MRGWDERFLGLAAHVAQWSKDPSTKCGAVIVRPDKTIASIGFNGFPMGISDAPLLCRGREEKLERIIHAEMNALLFLREPAGVWLRGHGGGLTLYTWPFGPCCRCAAHVIQAGIKQVVSFAGPPDRWKASIQVSRELFYEADVQFDELTPPFGPTSPGSQPFYEGQDSSSP